MELGIGTGRRRMMEQAFGLPWRQPIDRTLEYGAVLRDLIEEGRASHEATTTASRRRSGPPSASRCRSSSGRSGTRCAEMLDTVFASGDEDGFPATSLAATLDAVQELAVR